MTKYTKLQKSKIKKISVKPQKVICGFTSICIVSHLILQFIRWRAIQLLPYFAAHIAAIAAYICSHCGLHCSRCGLHCSRGLLHNVQYLYDNRAEKNVCNGLNNKVQSHHSEDKVSARRCKACALCPLGNGVHKEYRAAEKEYARIDNWAYHSGGDNGGGTVLALKELIDQSCAKSARIPLERQVMIVPGTFIAIKAAASVKSTTAPKTKPSHAPDLYPYSAAPTTIGISTNVTLKGPNLIPTESACKTATIAVRMPVPTSALVFSLIKRSSLLSFPFGIQYNFGYNTIILYHPFSHIAIAIMQKTAFDCKIQLLHKTGVF